MTMKIVAMSVVIVAVTVAVAAPGWGQERPMFMNFSSPTIGWATSDLSGLNTSLQNQGYPRLAHEQLIWGARYSLCPLFGFPKGWIFGMQHWNGGTTTRQGTKLARLMYSWAGGWVERQLPTALQASHELFIGLDVGVGFVSLTLLDHHSASFESALRTPATVWLTRWFFSVQPQLSVRLSLLSFITIRLSLGYMLTFDNGAWDQEGRALPGPPQNFNGWIVQLSGGI